MGRYSKGRFKDRFSDSRKYRRGKGKQLEDALGTLVEDVIYNLVAVVSQKKRRQETHRTPSTEQDTPTARTPMPESSFPSPAATPSLFSKAGSLMAGLGKRIVVHLAALAVAGFAGTGITGAGFFANTGMAFGVYIGLICLVPRGIAKSADWVIPTALGFFQVLLWAAFGTPWVYGVIWGGLTTWGIRCLMKKGNMGWEWAVTPFLIAALFSSINTLLPHGFAAPFWTPALFIPAGWAALLLYSRLLGDPLQRHILLDACARLDSLFTAKAVPADLAAPAQQLLQGSRRLLELVPRMQKNTAPLVEDINRSVARLGNSTGRGGYPLDTSGLQNDLAEVNARLHKRLLALDPPPKAAPTPDEPPRIAEFRRSAKELQGKAAVLPAAISEPVDGIVVSTGHILACMLDDPQDMAPGDRFLSRYLKAAHSVVDEYGKLAKAGSESERVGETLSQSEKLLERLQQAFTEQHERLLENDAMNLNAELSVLDKLLKMDGR